MTHPIHVINSLPSNDVMRHPYSVVVQPRDAHGLTVFVLCKAFRDGELVDIAPFHTFDEAARVGHIVAATLEDVIDTEITRLHKDAEAAKRAFRDVSRQLQKAAGDVADFGQ